MTTKSHNELLAAADADIQAAFTRIKDSALSRFPSARTFIRKAHGEGEAQTSLSILREPAADELAIEVQLVQRDTELWCEVTLYLGQTSPAILGWSVWNAQEPLRDQVAAIAGEFLAILERRFARIIEDVYQSQRKDS